MSEDYSHLPAYAHITLHITYSAGRAGVGWPTTADRHVRIPYVTTEAARHAFDLFYESAWTDVAHLQSGIPTGIEPDACWVAVEPRNGVSYPTTAYRDVFRTLRAFRRADADCAG